MVGILYDEMREERARVDEYPLHGLVAQISARYSFLRLEMSA
jgi:hypothetical protein